MTTQCARRVETGGRPTTLPTHPALEGPMTPTPTNPAALLREAADRLRAATSAVPDELGLAVAAWLESWTGVDLSEHGPMPEDAQHALTVARRVLGTTTGQLATVPWPPAVVARPDHGLYTLLRRTGLTPEAAQQEIDTYTQTILASQTPAPAVDRAVVLNERADFLESCLRNAADPGADPRYWSAISDVIRGLRRLAAEAQQQQPETEAAPYPTRHRWIAQELEGGDEWMQLASSVNRDYVEGRITSYQTRSPHGLTTRLVRETTTYTVEQLAAEAQQPTPDEDEETAR